MIQEINFDGIVGPTHNYAGLSIGNLAAAAHAGETAYPKAAALQGLAKMRLNLELGLAQGLFVALARPNPQLLTAIAADARTGTALVAGAWSASSIWTANAATVSPAADTADGRCHITPANLVTMAHRFQEWPDTARQLAVAFADPAHFTHHDPVMACFGDEGAANHMRMAERHDAAGIELFVYGRRGGPFPARQHPEASRILARKHALQSDRVLFVEQNPEAIAAGAFHNDVVAVANENVLLVHELAFAEPEPVYAWIREKLPGAEIIVVPDSEVSLAEAVKSYLFNAQLVTLGDGTMVLVVPGDAHASLPVRAWLDRLLAGNGPIRAVHPVDLRQSVANGGGPACLRLRVVADPATVDPRFLLDDAKADLIEGVVREFWPEQIDPDDIGSDSLTSTVTGARDRLLTVLGLAELA